jgi:predicted nicotinamide N-methyase
VPLTVSLDDVLVDAGAAVDAEVILAGDVFYDRDMADQIRPFLNRAHGRGATVLVGDPGRHYLPRQGLRRLETYQVPVPLDLEGMRTKATTVWQLTDELAARPEAGRPDRTT